MITSTGYQWAQNSFLLGTTDEARIGTVPCNYHLWKSIRPQVIEFFHANWAKWEAEKPKFFTAAFKKRLDHDLLPPDVLRAMKTKYGDDRRRSSLAEIMGFVGEDNNKKNTVVPVDDDEEEVLN